MSSLLARAGTSLAGSLDREHFLLAFRILRQQLNMTPEEDAQADAIVYQLFDLFDTDGNGIVDPQEMTTLLYAAVATRETISTERALPGPVPGPGYRTNE